MAASDYAFVSPELRWNPESTGSGLYALPEDRPITELILAENSASNFEYEMTRLLTGSTSKKEYFAPSSRSRSASVGRATDAWCRMRKGQRVKTSRFHHLRGTSTFLGGFNW